MNTNEASLIEKTSFYKQENFTQPSRKPQDHVLQSPTRELPDFIDFLAVAQWRDIDFMPVTWQQTLSSLGVGGTARVKQSIVSNELSLAFKRLHLENETIEGRSTALQILMTEVSVLGHPVIRKLPYFIRLEGICWDFDNGVDPVLVFRKAHHGNLRDFLASNVGQNITFAQRLQICSEIGSAVMIMHSFREPVTKLCETFSANFH